MDRSVFTKLSLVFLLSVSLFSFRAQAVPSWPHGDLGLDGNVSIADVTILIDRLLGNGEIYTYYDIDRNNKVSISDVSCLIDYLLNGEWHWAYNGPEIPDSAEVFTVNGVTFAMMPVEGVENWDVFGSENMHTWDVFGVHDLTLSLADFYLGQTEVTQELWSAVMETPIQTTNSVIYEPGPYEAKEYLTWDECQEFISRLNALTGREFHLPFVAQWAWAWMGGIYSQGYSHAGSDDIGEVAWHLGNLPYPVQNGEWISPVGMKKPNELGLYDMEGNVWEYCYNYYITDGDQIVEHGFPFCAMLGGGTGGDPSQSGWLINRSMTNGPAFALVGLRLALQKEQ